MLETGQGRIEMICSTFYETYLHEKTQQWNIWRSSSECFLFQDTITKHIYLIIFQNTYIPLIELDNSAIRKHIRSYVVLLWLFRSRNWNSAAALVTPSFSGCIFLNFSGVRFVLYCVLGSDNEGGKMLPIKPRNLAIIHQRSSQAKKWENEELFIKVNYGQ